MRFTLIGALVAAIGLGGCSGNDNGNASGAAGSAGTATGGSAGASGAGDASSGSGGHGGHGGSSGSAGKQDDGGSGGQAGNGGADGDVCAKQTTEQTADGYDVIRCHELFDAAPFVHLPAPPAGSKFAALSSEGFTGADGVLHAVAFDADEQTAEQDRHASAIYRIELSGEEVSAFEPWLLFDERVFLAPFDGGIVEGLVSRRTDDERYEIEPSLPVRAALSVDASGQTLGAEILNLSEAMTASDGACLPALASAGDKNPFDGAASVILAGTRTPSMHAFGDDTFVFGLSDLDGTVMGSGWFLGPLDVLTGELDSARAYQGSGHGTPGYIPAIALEVVSGGGDPCTP